MSNKETQVKDIPPNSADKFYQRFPQATLRIAGDLFKQVVMIALIYFAICLVIQVGVGQIIFHALGDNEPIVTSLANVLNTSSRTFMFILGIACPLAYFTLYLATGVTRKQFAFGLFAAATLFSCCYAVLIAFCSGVLNAPLEFMAGGFAPLALLTNIIYGALNFLIGWTAVTGFQLRRLSSAALGILCAAVVAYWFQMSPSLPYQPGTKLLLAALALCAIGALLLQAIKRIPVKC
jgi:hypothetical protein